MSTTTPILGLTKNADGDNARTALSTDLPANMDAIDALFQGSTGHNHSGAGTNGTPIPYTSISPVAWTDWTPTVAQTANITLTITFARYCVIGKIAFVQAHLALTSAGTAGASIILAGIPAAIAIKNTTNTAPLGTFTFFDTGTNFRVGAAVAAADANAMAFIADADNSYLGAAVTIANGDTLAVNCVYEIA